MTGVFLFTVVELLYLVNKTQKERSEELIEVYLSVVSILRYDINMYRDTIRKHPSPIQILLCILQYILYVII